MSETKVIHIGEMSRFPDAVYIGRAMPRQRLAGSPLANPYKIGQDGKREEVVDLYLQWLINRVQNGYHETINALIAARGKPLACWCRHDGQAATEDTACHGDEIIWVLDHLDDDALRAFKEGRAA